MNSIAETISTSEMFLQAIQQENSAGNQIFSSSKRNEAREIFQKLGFPTTRHEEWKYTNLAGVLKTNLRIAHAEEPLLLDKTSVDSHIGNAEHVIVIENGRFNESASTLNTLPAGITIASLTELKNDARIAAHLAKYAPVAEPMVALNTSLCIDGVAILVDDNIHIKAAIQILIVVNSADALAVQPRALVVIGKHASCSIVERHITIGSPLPHLANVVVETVCNANSQLNYVKLQDTDDSAFQLNFHQAWLERDAKFHITTLALNGALIRNNLHIRLNDQNCTAYLNGLYVVDGHQLVDNHTLVDHAFPNCYSNELYKGIIDDHGHGVFNGKIFVRQDAQKTNAYQSNKNLLLSNNASMNAKPQLEIFADDVKCSHGATTGQMDDEALFYLRARGIGEAAARALLNHAFAADVIEQIAEEGVRGEMLERLDRKLKI